MGFYTPYAVDQELTPYSNAAKIRQLFVIPNAAEREFFYGVNFEVSYAMPQFSDTQWNLEIRPIVGWRKLRIHHQPDRRRRVWTKRRGGIRPGCPLRAQSRWKSFRWSRVLHRPRHAAELVAVQCA